MDYFPLINSLRIASLSTLLVFFLGIFAAHRVVPLSRWSKGVLDCLLTLPMVLPPTVVGFFLLKLISPMGAVGSLFLRLFGFKMTMSWYSAVFATVIVSFPLMYRTARGAFEGFDRSLLDSARTLGLSDRYIFWRILLPNCKEGLLAGSVLAFARALGEFGATTMVTGYIPGKTATISTTVYQLWREGNDELAYRWVAVNLLVSLVVLLAVNVFEGRRAAPKALS